VAGRALRITRADIQTAVLTAVAHIALAGFWRGKHRPVGGFHAVLAVTVVWTGAAVTDRMARGDVDPTVISGPEVITDTPPRGISMRVMNTSDAVLRCGSGTSKAFRIAVILNVDLAKVAIPKIVADADIMLVYLCVRNTRNTCILVRTSASV
jgi:hypothetical protein